MSDSASDLHPVWEVYCAKCGLVGRAHDDEAANIWGKDHRGAHDYEATEYESRTRHVSETVDIIEGSYRVDCKACGLVEDNIISEDKAHVIGKNHLYSHECRIATRLETSDEDDSDQGREKTGEPDKPVKTHPPDETFEGEMIGTDRAVKYYDERDQREQDKQDRAKDDRELKQAQQRAEEQDESEE